MAPSSSGPPRMLTITVHGARGAGEPSGRSSTARRWFSNWLVTAPSWVQWPVLCGRIASSLTRIRPSRVSNSSTASTPVTSSSPGDASARPAGPARQRRVQVGRRGDDLVADAVQLDATRRRGTPRPGRSGLRATSAESSRRKSTRSSASSGTPVRAGGSNALRAVVGRRDEPDPLAVVPAARGLEDARAGRTPRRPRRRRRRPRCAGTGAPSSASRARITALSWAWTSASGPGPDGDARPLPSACRCSVGTCSWSKVTTCAPAGDLPQRLEVAVVADQRVGDDLRRRDALGLGQQPQRDAQRRPPAPPSSGRAGRRRSRRRRARGRARVKRSDPGCDPGQERCPTRETAKW